MLILSAMQIAASAVILGLSAGCARNVLQTIRIVENLPSSTVESLLPRSSLASEGAMVEFLKTRSREELLVLFCLSKAPADMAEIVGEWDGILLSNNNLGMTRIGSKFMSNTLFGMGYNWNGKTFGEEGKGINRFLGSNPDKPKKGHAFDVFLEPSAVEKGGSSIRLVYSKYQFPMSLWRTMIDEVRCLPGGVLIGFGSMAWSGGMLNSAPFCLYPANTTEALLN